MTLPVGTTRVPNTWAPLGQLGELLHRHMSRALDLPPDDAGAGPTEGDQAGPPQSRDVEITA